MKKNQLTSYLKNNSKEIVTWIKEENISNNNDANKFKNILKEIKEIEKNTLIPIEELKKQKYAEYKIILDQEKEIKNKSLVIKDLISEKLTTWNNYLFLDKNTAKPTVVITDNVVKKYKQIYIELIDIEKVPSKFINKILKIDEIKRSFKKDKTQIEGLKITEKEVIK